MAALQTSLLAKSSFMVQNRKNALLNRSQSNMNEHKAIKISESEQAELNLQLSPEISRKNTNQVKSEPVGLNLNSMQIDINKGKNDKTRREPNLEMTNNDISMLTISSNESNKVPIIDKFQELQGIST